MKKGLILLVLSFGVFTQCFSQTYEEHPLGKNIEKIKLFPNPATSVINVLGLVDAPKASIRISDVYGNTALQYQWEIKNNALNIPIADLEKGIYIISIQSQEQQINTKFYKQ